MVYLKVSKKITGISQRRIKAYVGSILRLLDLGRYDISIWLTDNRTIRRLNRLHKRHDYATDVLAYSQREGRGLAASRPLLGDVAISLDQTAINAQGFGTSFRGELSLYLIHGILHLAGYKDEGKKECRRLKQRQDCILGKLGDL